MSAEQYFPKCPRVVECLPAESPTISLLSRAVERRTNYFPFVTDLAAIRKILENETGGTSCPSCKMPFDKGKKRKLIDTCGHDRCYSCMFKNESCTICANTQRHQRQEAQRETSTGKLRRTKFTREEISTVGTLGEVEEL